MLKTLQTSPPKNDTNKVHLFNSSVKKTSGQIKKDERIYPENFTRILDRLLDGYDNRLRPGFGGMFAVKRRRSVCLSENRAYSSNGTALHHPARRLLLWSTLCANTFTRSHSAAQRCVFNSSPNPVNLTQSRVSSLIQTVLKKKKQILAFGAKRQKCSRYFFFVKFSKSAKEMKEVLVGDLLVERLPCFSTALFVPYGTCCRTVKCVPTHAMCHPDPVLWSEEWPLSSHDQATAVT